MIKLPLIPLMSAVIFMSSGRTLDLSVWSPRHVMICDATHPPLHKPLLSLISSIIARARLLQCSSINPSALGSIPRQHHSNLLGQQIWTRDPLVLSSVSFNWWYLALLIIDTTFPKNVYCHRVIRFRSMWVSNRCHWTDNEVLSH